MNAARQLEITAGLGCAMMRVVCAWCKADLGAKACEPHQVNHVSHGICPACSIDFVQGECLEDANSYRRCGLERVDAGSPALSLPGNKSLGIIEAASSQVLAPLAATRTSAPAGAVEPDAPPGAIAAMGHLSRGPAASFSFSARPLFWTVTGHDFARSIRWARQAGNSVVAQIRARRSGQ